MERTLYFWRNSLLKGDDINFLRMCDGAWKWRARHLRREDDTFLLSFILLLEFPERIKSFWFSQKNYWWKQFFSVFIFASFWCHSACFFCKTSLTTVIRTLNIIVIEALCYNFTDKLSKWLNLLELTISACLKFFEKGRGVGNISKRRKFRFNLLASNYQLRFNVFWN